MAVADLRAYRQHSKLNSEVLAPQQAGAAERMKRMCANLKEIFMPLMELDKSAFSMVQPKGKMKKYLKALILISVINFNVYNETAFEDKLVKPPKSKYNLNLSRNTAPNVINFFL